MKNDIAVRNKRLALLNADSHKMLKQRGVKQMSVKLCLGVILYILC